MHDTGTTVLLVGSRVTALAQQPEPREDVPNPRIPLPPLPTPATEPVPNPDSKSLGILVVARSADSATTRNPSDYVPPEDLADEDVPTPDGPVDEQTPDEPDESGHTEAREEQTHELA